MLNIVSELKKCCNHPALFEVFRERFEHAPDAEWHAALVRSSGKMVLLDSMLQKLRARGHRVLIFSQMTRLLDILEGE